MKFLFQFTSTESDSGRKLYTIDNGEGVHIGDTVAAKGTEIMSQSSSSSSFNDFNTYGRLRNQKGCVGVKIASIIVRCNSYIHGFQVTWESTFRNGRVVRTQGAENFYKSGYYSYHTGRSVDRSLTLAPDEFIHGIRVRQGEVLDAIFFVTNKREVHFGGHGGSCIFDDRMVHVEPRREIVALTGTVHGVVQRVGFYSKNSAWRVIGVYIMMRWLIDEQRASVKKPRKRRFMRDDPSPELIELIYRLMELPLRGPFSTVMMYLV